MTVQFDGIPLSPVGIVALAALIKVPEDATLVTQLFKQLVAEMSVASIVIEFRLVQP